MSAIPYACLILAVFLIFIPRGVMGREMAKQPGGYDNNTPRAAQANLTGAALRAHGAHLNAFEAFTLFAPAVLACELRHVDVMRTAVVSVAFVVLRAIYLALYLGDKASARSSVWGLGLLATLGLYVLAAIGG
ncbi:MAG: MAPEG family protein [Minicystis sp.]